MNKITNSEIQKYHVQSVTGNRLTGTVEQNKRVFDNFPQFVADRINEIIDELTGTGGAGSISTTGGTLQSVLDSYLASINDRYTKDATNTLVTAETKDLVKSVAVDINTGVITVTNKDGTATTIDTAIEKIPATFSLENDDATGKASLVVTNQDGSVTKTDVSNLLNHYTFDNTGLINFTSVKSADGYHITAVVNDASVGMAQLNAEVTDYINNVKAAVALSEANANTSETNAKTSETNASASASKAQSYAVGGTGTRTGEDSDNAKHYAEQASNSASSAESSASSATSSATSAATSAASAEKAYNDLKGIEGLGDITEFKKQLDNKADHKYNQNASVLGVTKTTEQLGDEQALFKKGGIFSGTAAESGIVTRGICGITTPDENGGCTKENLYINYDGGTEYKSDRQIVLQAGTVGAHYGHNLYQYAVARGDAVKGYVDNATVASARNATNATNATNDADGNPIKTTYRKVSDSYSKTEVDNKVANSSKSITITTDDLIANYTFAQLLNLLESGTTVYLQITRNDPIYGIDDTILNICSYSDHETTWTTNFAGNQYSSVLAVRAAKNNSDRSIGIYYIMICPNTYTTVSTISIAASAWDSASKTATVSVSGVRADNAVDVAPALDSASKTAKVARVAPVGDIDIVGDVAVDVSPAESSYDDYVNAGIRATEQGDETLTFACKTIPTKAISVNIKVISTEAEAGNRNVK